MKKRLLIDAQHDRVSRRVQIQAYNVGDLGLHLVGFFASDWTPGAMFAMNLKIVLNVFFFVQGLSLIW